MLQLVSQSWLFHWRFLHSVLVAQNFGAWMREGRLYFMFTSYCMVMTLHLHSSLLTLRIELHENHTSSQIPLRSSTCCRDISWEATDHWWQDTIADTVNYSYRCLIILVGMGSPQLSRRVMRHDFLFSRNHMFVCRFPYVFSECMWLKFYVCSD